MAATTGAEAQSSESKRTKSRQGNAKKGNVSFSMQDDCVLLTFTHGFSVSSKGAISDWIRHPLAKNKWWWKILMDVGADYVAFWCKCKAEGGKRDVTPCFTRAFSYIISKSTVGVLAKGQMPWLRVWETSTSSNNWIDLPEKIYFPVPTDKNFFVCFSMSILNDEDLIAALLLRSIPKAFPNQRVSEDQTIQRLWKSRIGSDLLIETADGIDIQAHRCFLMENSPVFAAMFTHDTLEKASGRLKLDDMRHVIVLEMLHFFYLGSVTSRDNDVLIELVKVADRYDVPNFKDVCEAVLVHNVCSDHKLGMTLLPISDNLNLRKLKRESELALIAWDAQNAVHCLHLAVDHSAELLFRYAAAMVYVCRRCNFSQDTDWKLFEAAHPDLAVLLLKEAVVMDFCGALSSAEARREDPK